MRNSCQCPSRATGSLPRKNGFKAVVAICPAISAQRPANPKEWPSTPSSVFMEITRKSKVDLPPTRISESVIASRVFRQTRTSMEVIFMRMHLPVVASDRVSGAPRAVRRLSAPLTYNGVGPRPRFPSYSTAHRKSARTGLVRATASLGVGPRNQRPTRFGPGTSEAA